GGAPPWRCALVPGHLPPGVSACLAREVLRDPAHRAATLSHGECADSPSRATDGDHPGAPDAGAPHQGAGQSLLPGGTRPDTGGAGRGGERGAWPLPLSYALPERPPATADGARGAGGAYRPPGRRGQIPPAMRGHHWYGGACAAAPGHH